MKNKVSLERASLPSKLAILETIYHYFKTALDHDNKLKCGIFLDFSKAFDTINHQILLSKMFKYVVHGTPFTWFSSYLSGCKQYVKIDYVESSLKPITCWVPQGSTLGPLIFLLYMNDLSNSSHKLLSLCDELGNVCIISKNSKLKSLEFYADDTNIFYSSKNN